MSTLGLSRLDRVLVCGGGALLGVGAGIGLPHLADWAETQGWLPWRWLLRPVASLDGFWTTMVLLPALGALVGLVLGFLAVVQTLTVEVTDLEITLTRDERVRTVVRGEVGSVFLDGDRLVVLDRESRQLVREKLEGKGAADAFRRHGYPWAEHDPYADRFHRWVPDTADLPVTLHVLLRARETALAKHSERDVRELGDEAQKLGFVLRDEGTRQYWRAL